MTNERQTIIRLYEDEAGTLTFTRDEYDVSDFGGHLPAPGDLIVDPGVRAGLDRHEPTNRQVFKVMSRYFTPGRHDDRVYVCLVVEPRAGTLEEANVL